MTVRLRPVSLDDGMSMGAWQRTRRLQLLGGAPLVDYDPNPAGAYPAPQDDMSIDDWIRSRAWQVRGGSTSPDGAAPMQIAALSQPQAPTAVSGVTVVGRLPPAKPVATRPPLAGRPGTAARIANSLNTIAGGANTTAPIQEDRVQGSISRDAGNNLRFTGHAQIKGIDKSITATGTLDPPTGRREITISDPKVPLVHLPPRIRVYTTPSGELDYDLPAPITFGPLSWPRGTYVIGEPDPPRR